ncbi:MAG: hypothetical protein A2Z12_01135 [Actinobacteria bacterium RBG_16_68_21]|nr:MAG: hypothetical protein A2Z12_01135 [Actinobacteria bacterium RBG_16_68_21]
MVLLAAGVGVSPAGAVARADGTAHRYGEIVDYPLAFPVIGETLYWESFWEPRANDIHHAVDIVADKLTPVVAAASGTVAYVNWSTDPAVTNPQRCCNLVIHHDDGWETWYIHLNNDTPGTDDGQAWGIAPGIVPGVHVEAGDLIGWVGDSGNAEDTIPHLHMELFDPDGVAVDPFAALRATEGKPVCLVTRVSGIDKLQVSTTLLKSGSTGAEVRELQRFLTTFRREPGPVDGMFGPRTDGAVRAFQDERGLAVDGVVGSRTRGEIAVVKLLSDRSSVLGMTGRLLRPGIYGGDVRELQELLHVVGAAPGVADGYYGPLTAVAVAAFQTQQGLDPDGIVGDVTRSALMRALGLEPLVTCG